MMKVFAVRRIKRHYANAAVMAVIVSLVCTACISVRAIRGNWYGNLKFDAENGTITDYNGAGRVLEIPSSINGVPVTVIGQEAFAGLMRNYKFPGVGLTSVTIPDGVQTIEANAFSGNPLTTVYVPLSVVSIAPDAFDRYVKIVRGSDVPAIAGEAPAPAQASRPNTIDDFDITQNADGGITITGYHGTAPNMVIPESIEGIPVTEIGRGAFANEKIITVVIPDSITAIGSQAFAFSQLTSVTIPESVTEIGDSTFEGSQLTSVTIEDGVKGIVDLMFVNNKLTSITLPDSVTSIGIGAFMNNQLTSATLGNEVTFIGDGAFMNNQLTSFTIPEKVTSLGGSPWAARTMGVFANNRLTSIVIPASVRGIDMETFMNNQISSVTIRSRDTNFSTMYQSKIFENNPLTSITLPSDYSDDNLEIFPNNLLSYYQSQGRKAGTYTWSGRLWSVK